MAHTVKTSWKDLGLLFMLVGMGQLVFGSLLYYIESGEEETGFTSIPQGMWWAVQTLTSLGYGDFPVQTVLGKLVRSFFFVLSFPVLIELLCSLSFSSFFHFPYSSTSRLARSL